MDFFKVLSIYFFSYVICLAAKAQPVDLLTSTNVTKSPGAKVVGEAGHASKKVRENSTEKHSANIKPICVDPRAQVKVQLTAPKPKSMPIPINFLIDTKPRTIPTKIPLVIKTANVQPAPAHYVRLKDLDRQNKAKPKVEINLSLNKPTQKMKVMPKDRIIPKSILNIALKNKHEKQMPRKKFKSVDFYEDDPNFEFLPSAIKTAVLRKNNKMQSKNESLKAFQPSSALKDLKPNTHKFETETDPDNEEVQIRNGTHLIRITKLAQHNVHEHDHTKKPHEHIFYEDPLPTSVDVLADPVNPQKEDTPVALIINNNGVETATEQTGSKVEQVIPAVTESPDDDAAGVITITNHNYEEVEERSGAYPENNPNNSPNQPWATPWQNTAKNPYNHYLQNLQVAYDQYLKYIAESNPGIYKKGNCYPRVDAPDSTFVNDPESSQTYPAPTEAQVMQDVYFGQKPDFNIIDIRPENNLGRIWRTWKDTEIKISKPNALLNKAIEIGRSLNNLNDINFGDFGKASTMYASPAIGLNGYYDNLNNPLAYPYPYPSYRYIL